MIEACGGWRERVEVRFFFFFASLLLVFFADRGIPKLSETLIWKNLDLYTINYQNAVLYTLKFVAIYIVLSGRF